MTEASCDVYNCISFDCGFMFVCVRNGCYGATVLQASKYDCINSVQQLYKIIIASSLIYFNGDSCFPGFELQLPGLNIQIARA